MTHKRTLITSALPYVNNVPHLGTMVCIVSADVLARYLRLQRREVLFVCGTDEHGTTTETKALEEGLTPKEVCDKYFALHKKVYSWFECQFDCFGRTSSNPNHEVTIDIFKKLEKQGYILEDSMDQSFCEKCNRFLSDRYIGGECPYCHYPEARGDQCEKCGKLINAPELINPKCKICGETPIVKTTNHLFIDLPKLEPKLREWINSVKGTWSTNAITMTEGWLKDGLKPRCITRDLKWGVPVPKKGYENKVFYSWFDAPIGYIGITKECRDDFSDWWLSNDTKLVQFMGKDNIPFHTILFPSYLIGTGDNYNLVKELSVNEYLNYEGGMFSKSRNIGIFGDDAMETGIPASVYRYYLMVNRPEKTDTEFSWKDLQVKINNELVANIGNLVNRTTVFMKKFFDYTVPVLEMNAKDQAFWDEIISIEKKITKHLDEIAIKEAIREIMHLGKVANQYLQENEPWKVINTDKVRAGSVLAILVNVVKDISILIAPFMPSASEKIQKQLGVSTLYWDDLGIISIGARHVIGEPSIVFEKLDDKKREEYEIKYAGKHETKKAEFALNLKVAQILEVKDHPDAEKLLIMQIDLGDHKRQLVAGIRKHYSHSELIGKKIVIVSNLKTAMLRGIKSEGMLLAGDDGDNVGLLTIDISEAGESVFIDGFSNNTKEITYEEFAKNEMFVVDGKIMINDKPLKTAKENVKVEKVATGAKVK